MTRPEPQSIITSFDDKAIDGEDDMKKYHCAQCGVALVLSKEPVERECFAVYLDTAHIPRRCGGALVETPVA